ncbi:MAG: 2'-5' RNA ligase family protein [Proteobacteria bacterium]|nr:2'-5' RNA ligase family protein [Pseudomonadota bacterium]
MFFKRESRSSYLYLMAKPPVVLAGTMAALPRARDYDAARLHMTLARLGPARDLPSAVLPWLTGMLGRIEIPSFRVVFDRIAEGERVVALTGTETMRGAVRAQRSLMRTLSAKGVPAFGPDPFQPHVTIRYRADGLGTEAIDPISWRVEEFMLVESVSGEGRHVEHGRWPLHRPAPAFSASE